MKKFQEFLKQINKNRLQQILGKSPTEKHTTFLKGLLRGEVIVKEESWIPILTDFVKAGIAEKLTKTEFHINELGYYYTYPIYKLRKYDRKRKTLVKNVSAIRTV